MAMEDEYDPFDVGGVNPATGESTYVSTGGPGRGTAASQLGYTSDQVYGGGGGDGDDNNRFIARPGAGLTKDQFEKTYGITDRNPFGRRPSGFAAFLDRFNRSLGGKGIDYSQQFRDLDRLHNRKPGTSAARFKQRQYDLYRNPDIDESGKITSGGIDRAGRGTYQGPIEMVTRQMGPGEQLVRTGIGAVPFAGSFLSGLGTEDPYLASRVTPEMRERENPTLAEQLKSSLGDRLQGLAFGNQQQAPVASGPVMGSRDPSREVDALAQSIPINTPIATPIAVEEANPQGPMMPAEFDQRLDDNTVADMLRDPSSPAPRPDLPLPDTYARNFGMNPAKPEDTFTLEDLFPELRNASNVGMNPAKPEDTFTVQDLFPELRNAPNEGLMRFEDRPRNAPNEGFDRPRNAPNVGLNRQEFLDLLGPESRSFGGVGESQAPTRDLRDSTALAELDIPSIADLLNSGLLQDLLTEQGPNTSVPFGGGTLNFNVNPNSPGIEFRRPLQGKDMGVGELLSFLSRRT